MTSNMRAFITKGNKIAAVENVPIPEPAEGEILVKIHYIAQVCISGCHFEPSWQG